MASEEQVGMGRNRHCACAPLRARRRGWAALLLSVGAWLPGAAQADRDEALKLLSVAGSLATWAGVAWQASADPWPCQRRGRLALDSGRDAELSVSGLGAGWVSCETPLRVAGQAVALEPWVMAHGWRARGEVPGAGHSWDLAAVPLLRSQWPLGEDLVAGVELGIGVAWLQAPDIGWRHKSTRWQFSDHLGLDVGPATAGWRVGLSYRHVSNGDLRRPNDGVDLLGLRLTLPLGRDRLR